MDDVGSFLGRKSGQKPSPNLKNLRKIRLKILVKTLLRMCRRMAIVISISGEIPIVVGSM